jgi:hypothetical protein
MVDHYKKRLSHGEIDRHALLVLKSSLKFFPDLEIPFIISVQCYGKTQEFEAVIEREFCQCRGNPHYHFYLDLLSIWNCFSFNPGDFVIMKKVNNHYTMELI